MVSIASLWLITSIALAGAKVDATSEADIRLAPAVSAWPEGLPDAQLAPRDGRWIGYDGADGGAGTWFPQPTDDAVHRRLLELDAYPGRCQARLDALSRLVEVEPANTGWPDWALGVAVVVGFVTGGALVLGAVAAVH